MKTFNEFLTEQGFTMEEGHFPGKKGTGERFKSCEKKMEEEGENDPAAACAAIGRAKYGKAKFQAMAAKGKK